MNKLRDRRIAVTSFHLGPLFTVKPSHLLTIISLPLALLKHVETRAHMVINCDKYLVRSTDV